MKYSFMILTFLATFVNCKAQDAIRIGGTHNFRSGDIVSTFSFDLNRTEKVDEKNGKYWLYNKNNFYILPASSIDIGEGTTSANNNILTQAIIGRAFFWKKYLVPGTYVHRYFYTAWEVSPTLNADKEFDEKLVYFQGKYLFNWGSWTQSFTRPDNTNAVTTGDFSFSIGPSGNFGYRHSKSYQKDHRYVSYGGFLQIQKRILAVDPVKNKSIESWSFSFAGNYSYLASELSEITTDNCVGILSASINRAIRDNLAIGVSYKYGNDNPKYMYVNLLELSLKLTY